MVLWLMEAATAYAAQLGSSNSLLFGIDSKEDNASDERTQDLEYVNDVRVFMTGQ